MDPSIVLLITLSSLGGAGLGLLSGLIPGIHCNTLAAMLLTSYPAMERALAGTLPTDAVALAVSGCVMSASVVHSFVDFVPSVFIGAPDSEDAISVLPGHRLLLEGRGMAAVRAAAIGSLIGCSAAILLSIPLQYAMMNGAGPVLDRLTPVVLVFASGVLILNEFSKGTGMMGLAVFTASGILGIMCRDALVPSAGILGEGTLLFPLLTGLFGLPVLLETSDGGRIPAQRDEETDPVGPLPGLKGVITGTVAGWFPGITSTVGASISACFMPDREPEKFISTVASVGTVTSVLSLIALSVSGGGRSGPAMVVKEIAGDGLQGFMSEGFLLMLLSMAIASLAGYKLTIWSGGVMSRVAGHLDQRTMSTGVVALLVVLVLMMTGPYGLLVILCATALGFVPALSGNSRTILCGCLMLPVLFP